MISDHNTISEIMIIIRNLLKSYHYQYNRKLNYLICLRLANLLPISEINIAFKCCYENRDYKNRCCKHPVFQPLFLNAAFKRLSLLLQHLYCQKQIMSLFVEISCINNVLFQFVLVHDDKIRCRVDFRHT